MTCTINGLGMTVLLWLFVQLASAVFFGWLFWPRKDESHE